MRIKFLGAAGTVTGSSYVLTSGSGSSILIDLGMFQGSSDIDKLNYVPYEYDPVNLDAAILTHAHLDHCGRLPIIVPRGFKGNFWMTPPTKDLTEISLLDSAKIAKEDNKPILYNQDLATQTILKFETVEYHETKHIGGFDVTFRDAGHILGSASLEIVDLNPDSEIKKIVFSGDLGNTPEPLEKATELIESADAVVMESTYGDRLHPNEDPIEKLRSEIITVERTGGVLLIPAFSLDRTQEILHMIRHLKNEGKVSNETPVYLDSPMGERATKIYVNYPQDFNQHIQNELKSGDVFEFQGLTVIENYEESRQIHSKSGPLVIIAGSGMMVGGRIVGHAAHFLPIPTTRLLIVGYQGEGTLGRELLEGKRELVINGIKTEVNGSVSETQAMSSHADQIQLMNWLGAIKGVKKLFLTHGEDGPRTTLSKKISEELEIKDITLPVLNQEVVI